VFALLLLCSGSAASVTCDGSPPGCAFAALRCAFWDRIFVGALVGGQVVLSLSLSLFAHLLFQGPHVLCGLHFCILQKSKKEKEKVDGRLYLFLPSVHVSAEQLFLFLRTTVRLICNTRV